MQRFFQSDAARELERQYQEEHLAERRALVGEVERLEAAWGNERARLDGEVKRTKNSLEEVREALRKAEEEHARAVGTLRSASFGHDHALQRLERKLREGAPEVLDDFLKELRDLADETRRAIQSEEPVHSLVPWNEKPGLSNAPSVRARLEAIRRALDEAEALKLAALAPDELAAHLDALRRGLPEIGPMVPVEA
ncbi:MAG: hypothetical protein HY689_09875 [Chloroflexi bacterium]|nr:hypothetical protein [Chloroflexota bacterium]